MSHVFETSIEFPVSADDAFAWHERPGALERLIPPWRPTRVVERTGGVRDGDRVELRVPVGPLRLSWIAEHRGYDPGRAFSTVQIRGPMRGWAHARSFEPRGAKGCLLTERIEYELPLGAAGRIALGRAVRRTLERVFRYRHRVTAGDLALHDRFRDQPRRRVAVTGASGLVGGPLCALLTAGGHDVVRLVRRPARNASEAQWDPASGIVDRERMEGVAAVVHLAGENIAAGLWTRARMQRIRDSRVAGTRNLCTSLASLADPPRVLVGASAVGFYGDRGQAPLTETSEPGAGFLAEVCRAWEAATEPLVAARARIVHARLGVVLTPAGGLLPRLLGPARFGIASVFGRGERFMSWISIDDVIGALHHALLDDTLAGPVNVTAPEPVTQRDLARALGRVLHRPALGHVPAGLMRLVAGRLADEMLLASTRARPERLAAAGFRFRDGDLEVALGDLLGRRSHVPHSDRRRGTTR